MADVIVKAADMSGDRVSRMKVQIEGLPARVIDRDTAIAWLRDGHSLIPWVGRRGTALQLVEVGDDATSIRMDNAPESADQLPELPGV